jgi:hypothetical protein
LLEAPGPKATTQRGGSGIVSCNDDDGTAKNTWETRTEAGVNRGLVVHWNAILYYLGDATRIRAWNTKDVAAVGPLLAQELTLMPALRAVILGGKAAQEVWSAFAPASSKVVVIRCPHPSPTNLNTRPGTRTEVVAGWRSALAAVTGTDG